jgi:hypothetical protein
LTFCLHFSLDIGDLLFHLFEAAGQAGIQPDDRFHHLAAQLFIAQYIGSGGTEQCTQEQLLGLRRF